MSAATPNVPREAANPATTSAAIEALLLRARTGLISEALQPSNRPHYFDFWSGYAKALNDLRSGAGELLAAKDAALPYEPPGYLRAAAEALHVHTYALTRVEIVERVRQAGIEISANPLPDFHVIPAAQLVHGAVATVDLHGEHAAPRVVDNDDALVHATSVEQGGAA